MPCRASVRGQAIAAIMGEPLLVAGTQIPALHQAVELVPEQLLVLGDLRAGAVDQVGQATHDWVKDPQKFHAVAQHGASDIAPRIHVGDGPVHLALAALAGFANLFQIAPWVVQIAHPARVSGSIEGLERPAELVKGEALGVAAHEPEGPQAMPQVFLGRDGQGRFAVVMDRAAANQVRTAVLLQLDGPWTRRTIETFVFRRVTCCSGIRDVAGAPPKTCHYDYALYL